MCLNTVWKKGGLTLQQVRRTRHAVNLFCTGKLKPIGNRSSKALRLPEVPPREVLYAQNIVDPVKILRKRDRSIMQHALANIE